MCNVLSAVPTQISLKRQQNNVTCQGWLMSIRQRQSKDTFVQLHFDTANMLLFTLLLSNACFGLLAAAAAPSLFTFVSDGYNKDFEAAPGYDFEAAAGYDFEAAAGCDTGLVYCMRIEVHPEALKHKEGVTVAGILFKWDGGEKFKVS
jgi:hypothetical protein